MVRGAIPSSYTCLMISFHYATMVDLHICTFHDRHRVVSMGLHICLTARCHISAKCHHSSIRMLRRSI
jgi:hypothetical protein